MVAGGIAQAKETRPVIWFLEAIGLSSKTWYAPEKEADDTEDLLWKARMETVLQDFPRYGSIKVTKMLQRAGYTVNKKKVQRLMQKYGLTQKRRRSFVKTTDSRHNLPTYPNLIADLVISYPNHVWVADITYSRLPNKTFCYLATILDVFTRKPRGWALADHMREELVTTALQQAIDRHGAPEYFHSDRGGQYCGKEHTGILEKHGIRISMSATGVSVDNPFAESFFRTIKVEEVELSDYRDLADARRRIADFIEVVYTQKRIHASLGYLTPDEFEAAWLAQKRSIPLTAA
jgi:transposase InsO family protein